MSAIQNAALFSSPEAGSLEVADIRRYVDMMYAAPVWAKAAQVKSYMKGVETTYRLCAIRSACSFRASAGQVPLMELPRERKEIHEASQAALQLYVQSRDKEGRLTEKPGDLSGSV